MTILTIIAEMKRLRDRNKAKAHARTYMTEKRTTNNTIVDTTYKL